MHRGGIGRRDGDHSIVSDEDLEKIASYFWNAINTPRGLIQKVWFDLMLHLGADGKPWTYLKNTLRITWQD